MTKKYTFVANWKMYLNFDESIKYITDNMDALINLAQLPDTKIVIGPSFPMIYPMTHMLKSSKIEFSAQDCSTHANGAFTGQVSVKTLSEIGCKYCIIGHSEIRHYNNETDEIVAKKIDLLIDQKISPIICIGENESQKKDGHTFSVLEEQIKNVLELVKIECNKLNGLPIFIAYEPLWSIGSGTIPEKDHLETVFAWLHGQVQKNSASTHWNLLYGGSLSEENIAAFKKIDYLSGFLIGKSSTNFQEFEKIVKKIYYS
ncbi:MAG: Triosephosphate isomerase [candidate division TM6 bacterium GW2011_GWF2_37_49]|nr:MAG: Triosephosphate isomerase [candidate division TM6 bacterium GW2011_GWF2_37_49]